MTTVLSQNASSGLGILNYGDLKDATALWLNRTDLADQMPIFVRLAETTIRRDVRVRVQEQLLTWSPPALAVPGAPVVPTMPDPAAVAADGTIPCPALLLDARRLVVAGKRKEFVTPEQFQDMDAASMHGDHFTIIGQSIYVLGGATGATYSLLYWQAFKAFADDPDTNWLLLNAPEVYLWSSCKEGAEYLKDFEAADRFGAKYAAAVMPLNMTEKNMRFSGSTLQVRVRGSTP